MFLFLETLKTFYFSRLLVEIEQDLSGGDGGGGDGSGENVSSLILFRLFLRRENTFLFFYKKPGRPLGVSGQCDRGPRQDIR